MHILSKGNKTEKKLLPLQDPFHGRKSKLNCSEKEREQKKPFLPQRKIKNVGINTRR
jgi:hypothetical protein